MSRLKKQNDTTSSMFTSSVYGVANILAIIITFLGTPAVYGRTIDWVQRYAASNYGYGLEDFVALMWGLICMTLVFFVSRASVSTALVMGGLTIATRLL